MSMIGNKYRLMAKMAIEHDAVGFLKNHGTVEINAEALIPTAMDLFRNDAKYMEKIRLYKAVKKFSDVLVGNYTNNNMVQTATTTAEFVQCTIKMYNLLVRLKNHNKFNEYKKIVDVLKDTDILIRSIPNNINYTAVATMLVDLYLNAALEIGCERALLAAIDDSSEKQETKN